MLALNMTDAKTAMADKRSMDDSQRVLLLVTQADWGGVQSFLVRFACALKDEGYEVLLAAGGEGELWQQAKAHGIAARQLRHMVRDINPLQDCLAIGEIKRLIDDFKPDAMHLNSSKMGVLGSVAARLSKTRPRVVYRIGGWSFLEPIAGWKKWLYRTAEKFSAPYKDVIITVHPGDEIMAKRLGILPRRKIVTVPNGLDFDAFTSRLTERAEARNKLGLPHGAFVFGTVANAYATKGLLPYLDVLDKVLKSGLDSFALIMGDGPEFEAVKNKRHALKLERLILTGHRDDAATLYRAFDVFVLPSRKEGMPWTVLEAMAAGVAVVATDVGACRWMVESPEIGRAGVIVPAQDQPALTDALNKLSAAPRELEEMAKTGPEMVRRRFTWETTYRGNRDALLENNQ